MKKAEKKAGTRKAALKAKGTRQRFPDELKLKVARARVDDKVPAKALAKQFGVSLSPVERWARAYRKRGAAAFGGTKRVPVRRSGLTTVREAIVDLKQQHPKFGTQRISDVLKRFLHLPGSQTTVRATLHEAKLMPEVPPKYQKKRKAPRRFERSRPNQMWQSDIHTHYLTRGSAVYFVGYIDDCSRYMVAMDVFTAQTAANVIGVYRQGRIEYGTPTEMLTDNGRQYASWRGTTDFEREMKKDQVRHIRSRPHHPMTLGKIERFWKTLEEEFLNDTTFASVEEVRERLRWFLKYYNFQRPHQGLDGICPADRYFGVESETRRVMAAGITENMLQLARHGKPRKPFVMIGQMGGQTVTVEAHQGKVQMRVDGQEQDEYTYQLKGEHNHGGQQNDGGEATATNVSGDTAELQRADEIAGDIEHLGRETEAAGDMPGTGNPLGVAAEMGEPGAGRDADRPVAGADGGGYAGAVETGGAITDPAGENAARGPANASGETIGEHHGTAGAGSGQGGESAGETARKSEDSEVVHGQEKENGDSRYPGSYVAADREGLSGGHGADDRPGGGPANGREPEDVLHLGTACPGVLGSGGDTASGWTPGDGAGPGERAVANEACDRAAAGGGTVGGTEGQSAIFRVLPITAGGDRVCAP